MSIDATRLILTAVLLAGACAAPRAAENRAPPAAADEVAAPTGARIEPSGYATILEAAPVPYPDEPPPSDRGESEPQRIARETGISVAEAEERMNPDEETREAAMALRERLRREVPDDFIDLRIVRDPFPRFVFQFRRDGAATLARFTSDPRFTAAEGGVPAAELEPLMHEWLGRFGRLASAASIDPFEGIVEIHLGVSRSEYEAIAANRDWRLPPRVRLTYAPEIDEAAIVVADVAPFIRTFARADRTPHIILTVAKSGRIVLRDGCFRVDDGRGGGPLALFGRNTRLHRDDRGWLTVSSLTDARASARIGEPMIWGGYPDPVEDEPGVRALRRHCGGGEIASVGEPTSAHAFRVRPWAIDEYARARGLSRQRAWDEIKACWAREDARSARERRLRPFSDCDLVAHPPPRR